MLSICIPVFNFEVGRLAEDLLAQTRGGNFRLELLIWDDASELHYREKNGYLAQLDPLLRYRELPNNIGRSRIRNELARAASYDHLLFLDGDAELVDQQFLSRYFSIISEGLFPVVICGGRVYPEERPPRSMRLHWKYGRLRESRDAACRSIEPNASFMTNNFLISKSIFEHLQFNESLRGYGHEDTLFGWELSRKGIQVRHIENPVRHIGLERSSVFIAKTQEGIQNLFRLHLLFGAADWPRHISLLRLFRKLRSWRSDQFAYSLLKAFEAPMLRQLQSGSPSMLVFDCYKLFLLLREQARHRLS